MGSASARPRVRWLFLAVLLAPLAGATHATPVDVMHARALETARWTDAQGTMHDGVLGDGVYFATVEDPATS